MEQSIVAFISQPGQSRYCIPLTFRFAQEGTVWCGHCVELGTAYDDEDLSKVQEVMREFAHGMLEMSLESPRDTLEDYLAWQGVPRYLVPGDDGVESKVATITLVEPVPAPGA